jgi:hypothetical protein
VVPELLQGAATPPRMARRLGGWLDAPARITQLQQRFTVNCTMNCSATPQHWQPMRSSKFLKAEQARWPGTRRA